MKPIKIDFCDFWAGFDRFDNYFTRLLGQHFPIEVSDDPDFVFYSTSGQKFKTYTCVRIYYTGESFTPNFSECDYAISFDPDLAGRNLRYPLYLLYGDMRSLLSPKKPYSEVKNQHTRFCNMVVSNARAKERIEFFHKLSAYKPVDSGGRYLNNVGGPIDNKLDFISRYKFTIAFENKIYPGYITEKLVEPMFSHSMPIYWGTPDVAREFNTRSFINWHDYGSDEAVIERIIELDQNDDLYEAVYNEPYFPENKLNSFCDEQRLLDFMEMVFSNKLRNSLIKGRRHLQHAYFRTRIQLGRWKQSLG